MEFNKNVVEATLEEQKNELIEAAASEHPGIDTLMKLYGSFDSSFKQSQEYLQLMQPISNSSYSTSAGV